MGQEETGRRRQFALSALAFTFFREQIAYSILIFLFFFLLRRI